MAELCRREGYTCRSGVPVFGQMSTGPSKELEGGDILFFRVRREVRFLLHEVDV